MYVYGILLDVLDWFASLADAISLFFGPLVSGILKTVVFWTGALAVGVFVGCVLFRVLRRVRIASRRFDGWLATWREYIVLTWRTISLALVNCKLRKLIAKRRALRRKLSGFSPHRKRRLAKAV